DDHAVVRAGIRNALDDQPHLHIVGEVGDGPSLLSAIDELQPDLIVTDVTMPGFEPITAVSHIRQRYSHILILIISAYDDDVYVQGLLRAGVNGYHLKDQPLSDLRLAVERVLSGGRWISDPLVDKLLQPTAAPQNNMPELSPRQVDILRLLTQGLDNRAIAAQLGLSVKTIETHLTRLYRQLHVQSRLEAVNYAHQHPGLIPPDAAQQGPPLLLPQEQQTSILVVDDNQRYRQQLRRMIERVCPLAAVYEAANIADAHHLARRIEPQIVLVDVVLGDEDGIRCTRQIKSQSPQSRIILMSAYPDREFHRRGLKAGANAFVDKKDLDSAALYQIVTDAVG
ncbi:MAG: response regulator transcription factor, partial [Chloroflexi bacterium]|nr:response regulator transcription factor [Chloroflexota bacterium]